MNEAIAYIGVGLMGGPMVRRLIEKGHAVRAYDISAACLREAEAAGASIAASPSICVVGADIVVLNLPTPNAVEDVVFGVDGIVATVQPPAIVVDFSTIEVARSRELARRLKTATGCNWVDAPVSGGPIAARDGTLAVMAGGARTDIDRLRGFFDDVSGSFTHMGDVGNGLAAKMVSQLIVGCLHVVLAESARMAELCGLDASRIPSCVNGGHADGVLLRQLYPRLVERDFAPRAYSRQLAKDLHMLELFAADLGLAAPMLKQASETYETLVKRGFAELDAAAVIKIYE